MKESFCCLFVCHNISMDNTFRFPLCRCLWTLMEHPWTTGRHIFSGSIHRCQAIAMEFHPFGRFPDRVLALETGNLGVLSSARSFWVNIQNWTLHFCPIGPENMQNAPLWDIDRKYRIEVCNSTKTINFNVFDNVLQNANDASTNVNHPPLSPWLLCKLQCNGPEILGVG